MRRVLVVSYLWPPAGNVGVQRTLRFVKRLRQFGWEPVVLTPDDALVDSLQPTLIDQIPPDVQVYRTASFEPFNRGYSVKTGRTRSETGLETLLWRVPRDIWKSLAVPDEKRGWVGPAVREASRILTDIPVDAIYVTGKPFSSYLIGERLSTRFGIPWLMDLRDLWMLNRRDPVRNRWHLWRGKQLERRLVHSAAGVITNTPGNRSDFVAAYRDCPPHKFVTITNGFDADDFRDLPQERFDIFTIAYTGTFYGERASRPGGKSHETHSPRFLFEALAELFRDRPELRDRVRVKIAGPKGEYVRAEAKRFSLSNAVDAIDVVSHRGCLELLSRSHLQWLVCSRGDASAGWVPCKLYQYLAVRTPILGLLPEGDAAEIIRRTGTGVVVPPDDVAAIRTAVEGFIDSWDRGGSYAFRPNADEIGRYESRSLGALLAECLEAVTGFDHAMQGRAFAEGRCKLPSDACQLQTGDAVKLEPHAAERGE